MKKILFALLVVVFSCSQEEEMDKMILLEGSTYNYSKTDCDNSDPELNQCSGFVFFHSDNMASGLLDGGDIVAEYTYNQENETLFLIPVGNGNPEEFKIASENTLIRISDNSSWERSDIVLSAQ